MKKQRNNYNLPLMLLFGLLLPAGYSHAAGETTRVSVDSVGIEGNSDSVIFHPSISADGRYVAITSMSDNLVPGDTNGESDVFIHDRQTGATTRVSVDSAGFASKYSPSHSPSISADGRYVAFLSTAYYLVPEKTSDYQDVFVHDRLTGATSRVSVGSTGRQGNSYSSAPSISADGRYVAFLSWANNLVPADTNGAQDVFVHDRTSGSTTRVSVNSAGQEANGGSESSFISADGRYVAFTSWGASNLVPGESGGFIHDRVTGTTTHVVNGSDIVINADGRYVAFRAAIFVPGETKARQGIFVHDRTTGATTQVNVDSAGAQVKGITRGDISISADGRYIAFNSTSPDLVPEDHNRTYDVFVHDRLTGATTRVSVDSAGLESDLGVTEYSAAAISADGRYVVFGSDADNLVSGDANGATDIFVRDRWLRTSQSADLELTVTSQPNSVQNGDVGRYIFTITNHGPDNAYVNLIDTVSGGKVWSLTPSQGSCSMAAVSVCRLKNLAAGASATVRTVFKAKGDPLTQQVSISASQVDTYPDNNSITIATPVEP